MTKRFSFWILLLIITTILLWIVLARPPVGHAQPDIPVLRKPPPGATVSELTFSWYPVPDVVRYEIEIWSMQAGIPVQRLWQATTHLTSITPREMSDIVPGVLSWRVRAVDTAGRKSAWAQDQVTYQLQAPEPLAPIHEPTLSADQPLELKWATVAGATAYQVEIASTGAFTEVIWSATTTDLSIIPPVPVGTGDQYWRVRGLAPGEHAGPFSPVYPFRRQIDAPENLVSPHGSIPIFLWDPVDGATSYTIQVSETENFSTPPIWEASTVNTRIIPLSTFLGMETRYWRVRAADAAGFVSPWTPGAPFQLSPPQGIITLQLMQPAPDAVLATDPTFQWQPVENADHYVLEVATTPSFISVYDRVVTNHSAYTPFTDIGNSRRMTYENGTYYWRVHSLDAAGNGITSEIRSFTKAVPLQPVSPPGGSIVSHDPVFRWSRVPGARNYHLLVSPTTDFTTLWDNVDLTGTTAYVPFASQADQADVYPSGVYYWKVESVAGDGTRLASSNAVSFTKSASLTPLLPADGAELLQTPTFSWTSVAGAFSYRLNVFAGTDLSTRYDQVVTEATRYTPYVGEAVRPVYQAGLYQWFVEALDRQGRVITASPQKQFVITGEGDIPAPNPPPVETASPSPTLTTPATTTATAIFTPTSTPTASVTPTASATRRPTHTLSPTQTPDFRLPTPTPGPAGRTDTYEPNDTWAAAVPLSPGIYSSYISHERDLDWFKVHIEEPHTRLRVVLRDLPADYDLALLGDPEPAGVSPLPDLVHLNPSGQLQTRGTIDDLGMVPAAGAVRSISARHGLATERVFTDVRGQPGWYYILVKGYNGAYSQQRYTLEIQPEPANAVRPCTVDLPTPPGVIIGRWRASEAPQTLILVNPHRVAAYYGEDAGLDETWLRNLAEHPQVQGLIEPVEDNPEILNAYNAWDADACNPAAANRVAEEIKQRMDDLRRQYPSLRQVLIIGNDDIIPFYRVPDETQLANETAYHAMLHSTADAPLRSALEYGYVLTDDFYGDVDPLVWRGRRLFIADYPVGRLVESPPDIQKALQTFLQMDGQLTLQKGLIFGYDFSADSAHQVAEILQRVGLNIESRTNLDWTGTDLRNGLLGETHDINIVNTRFTHQSMLPPAPEDAPLTAETVAEVGNNLQQSLFLSIGAHAGLNLPDRWADPSEQLDFSQAFSQAGVTSILNTGYGYGVPATDEYSERIMLYLVEALGTTAPTVGDALIQAKQRFFSENGPAGFSVYHEKALIEMALFGVPGLQVNVPHAGNPTTSTKNVTQGPLERVGPNLHKRPLDLFPRFERTDTDIGSYLAGDDGTTSAPGRPVQPRLVWSIREPELAAHGALLTHATYTDLPGFDPLVTYPITETMAVEPDFPFDVWVPARLHTIQRLATPAGTHENLVVTAGQFRSQSLFSSRPVERRYDSLSFDVYYSTSADWTPPSIWQVWQEKSALATELWVEATDASGIERVLLTYTRGDGEWRSIEMRQIDQAHWQVPFPLHEADAVEYMVQVVDGAGNVQLQADKGQLFGRRGHRLHLPLVQASATLTYHKFQP